MKSELINPFLKSSKDIFAQVGNIQLQEKEPYEKKSIELNENIGVVIGLTGALKGQVIINLPMEIGKKIASNMMGGMPVVTLDDIAKSAISEMGNMLMGSAATNLYDVGLNVDITPPSIISGKEMAFTPANQHIICIPFDVQNDVAVEVNLAIKKE